MARIFNLNNKKFKNGNQQISSLSEDSNVILQSYTNGSFAINNNQRDNHYIKHPKLNPNDDHITSLKRRIRKKQSTQDQNQENLFQLPLSNGLFLISYSQQPMSLRYDQIKKSSCVVSLPPLINNTRATGSRVHGIHLNRYVF